MWNSVPGLIIVPTTIFGDTEPIAGTRDFFYVPTPRTRRTCAPHRQTDTNSLGTWPLRSCVRQEVLSATSSLWYVALLSLIRKLMGTQLLRGRCDKRIPLSAPLASVPGTNAVPNRSHQQTTLTPRRLTLVCWGMWPLLQPWLRSAIAAWRSSSSYRSWHQSILPRADVPKARSRCEWRRQTMLYALQPLLARLASELPACHCRWRSLLTTEGARNTNRRYV